MHQLIRTSHVLQGVTTLNLMTVTIIDTQHNGTQYIVLNFNNQYKYCIEGSEMRQRGFKVRRLLFLNRY